MADDCIFCKIATGELPATKVHEGERPWAPAPGDRDEIAAAAERLQP